MGKTEKVLNGTQLLRMLMIQSHGCMLEDLLPFFFFVRHILCERSECVGKKLIVKQHPGLMNKTFMVKS